MPGLNQVKACLFADTLNMMVLMWILSIACEVEQMSLQNNFILDLFADGNVLNSCENADESGLMIMSVHLYTYVLRFNFLLLKWLYFPDILYKYIIAYSI